MCRGLRFYGFKIVLGTEPAGIPKRQIRALYDQQTVTVYQAYSPEIASALASSNEPLS